MQSKRWASGLATSWSRPWAWATSSECCRTPWQTAAYTAWNWTALPGALRKSCTRRLTLLLLALRPPTGVISTIWRWATCPLVSTRSTIRRTTSWDSVSTIISLRKPSTKCVRAAWWRLLPVVTRWTVKILLPANTWQNVPICWGLSVCPTMRSVPTLAQMLSVTLSFYRSVTAPSTMSRTGCSWARPRMALLSTATLLSTRRWCWAN